jgi:exopolysaccharide biosynthesis WecB/TagA/CpsF family protein
MPNLEERSESVYFFGAKAETLQALLAIIRSQFPRLPVSCARNRLYGPADEEKIVADIDASVAAVLFVAMGSPYQEFLVEKYRAQMRPRAPWAWEEVSTCWPGSGRMPCVGPLRV